LDVKCNEFSSRSNWSFCRLLYSTQAATNQNTYENKLEPSMTCETGLAFFINAHSYSLLYLLYGQLPWANTGTAPL
jgi:hypothetical protein